MGENERIIGSCLEINSDIIRMKFEDTKLPKVIINLREKFYRYKLIKTVRKLEKISIPLNKYNLVELFSYLYSNFPPYGSYKQIKQIIHIEKDYINIWKAVIRFSENIVICIDINQKEEYMTVSSIVDDLKTDERKTYTDYLTKLDEGKQNTKDIISELNKMLINIIMDYILSVIESSSNLEERKINE